MAWLDRRRRSRGQARGPKGAIRQTPSKEALYHHRQELFGDVSRWRSSTPRRCISREPAGRRSDSKAIPRTIGRHLKQVMLGMVARWRRPARCLVPVARQHGRRDAAGSRPWSSVCERALESPKVCVVADRGHDQRAPPLRGSRGAEYRLHSGRARTLDERSPRPGD